MEASILQDLSIIIAIAGVTAIICSKIKFPMILGYLVAGFLIGPNCFSNSLINNQSTIQQLSELGVIFLMFYVGMEFDLKKLTKTFLPSFSALLTEAVGMIFIGCLIAPLFGWSGLNGLFLGALLSISSTMTSFQIAKSKNALNTYYTQISIGTLIFEDILAVLLLVVLSGIAVTGHFAWEAVTQVTFLVGVFVVVVFCLGKLIAPYFVRFLKKIGSTEVIAVTVVGLALFVGELAVHFKFSVALGSFLAGSIMSGSNLSDEFEETISPFRNVFGAVFFTTTGMILSLDSLLNHGILILCLAVTIVVVRTLMCSIAIFLSGESAKNSFMAASTNCHIGEFSFIIASLGCSLGVVKPEMMSVAAGTSLLTICCAILINKRSEKIFDFVYRHTPNFILELGKFYHNMLRLSREHFAKKHVLKAISAPLMRLILWFFLLSGAMFAVSYTSNLVYSGALDKYEQYDKYGIMTPSIFALCLFVCLPFLFGIIKNVYLILEIVTDNAIKSVQTDNSRAKNRVIKLFKTIVLFVILFFFGVVFLSTTTKILPAGASIGVFVVMAIVIIFVARQSILNINKNMELMFVTSFNNKVKTYEQEKFSKILKKATNDIMWDTQLKEIVVPYQSGIIGKKLKDIDLHKNTGATLIAINRNNYTVYSFGAETIFFPHDKLIVVGDEEQIENATRMIYMEGETVIGQKNEEFTLFLFSICENEAFVGKTLSDVKFRNNFKLNVVGVQRSETKTTNLKPDMIFEPNDILLLAGTDSAIEAFKTMFN